MTSETLERARAETSVPAAVCTKACNVLLVDPSLFTAPYDAALSRGLERVGIRPVWATRGLRAGEENLLGARARPIFYGLSDGARRRSGGAWRAIKGFEHATGMRALTRLAEAERFYAVHLQWSLVPAIDRIAIRGLRKVAPVVLTVHDTTPFNGKAVSRVQRDGFDAVLHAVDRLIVHTDAGRSALVARGVPSSRIAVVPHGLLPHSPGAATRVASTRWRIVLFGKLQDYKGADVLVEALGRLDAATRARLQVIVAGEPMIDLAPLKARAAALGIDGDTLEFRPRRLADAEVDTLIAEADAFVFPYRAIEASGVLFLVASAGKWLIASDLGAFSETIGHDGAAGALVPPGDVDALAGALAASVGRRPARDLSAEVPGWEQIAAMTVDVYRTAAAAWRQR